MRNIYRSAGIVFSVAVATAFLIFVAPIAGQFFYENEPTYIKTDGGLIKMPAAEESNYGAVRAVWIREVRKPKGIAKFPDGGRALETAFYVSLRIDDGETARINLRPVRRSDFGDIISAKFYPSGADRIDYEVVHGYSFYPKLILRETGRIYLSQKTK